MQFCLACRAAFRTIRTCPKCEAPLRADVVDPMLGAVIGERYRIVERIAAGGMGLVYRAAHTRIASTFAVKVLFGDLTHDVEMRTRFSREAEVASLLSSRHIVRVIDFGETPEDVAYLVMEHLRGEALSDRIARTGGLPPRQVVRIVRQIARGLLHAHERGIVHRDLKPDNVILVVEDDERDVVKVLDFGIASRVTSDKLTRAGTIMGTPYYMAPEQFVDADVDARADLYALGVIAYEMATGKVPFSGGTLGDIARAHATEQPPPLRARIGDDPEARRIEAAIERLLQKAIDARPGSARDVLALLDAETTVVAPVPARPSIAPTSGATLPVSPGAAVAPPVSQRFVATNVVAAAPPQTPGPSRPPPSRGRQPVVGTNVVAAIRGAIDRGAPVYNTGNHRACFDIYRTVASAILTMPGDAPIAVRTRLRMAMEVARLAPDPTTAAWTLRYAFDDLLACRGEVAPVSDVDYELSAISVVMRSLADSGRQDILAAFLSASVDELLTTSALPDADAETLRRALATARGAGDPAVTIGLLGQALEGLRARSGSIIVPPTAEAPPPMRLPEEGAAAIVRTIGIGAPLYNAGDIGGCFRTYLRAADELSTSWMQTPTMAALGQWLAEVVGRARNESEKEGAWTLRHAFDSMLSGGTASASRPTTRGGR